MNINPHTKLWNAMKQITISNKEIDTFDRHMNNMFIENNDELTIIGKEIFENFGIKNINFFVDVCAAPGMYSKLVFENNKDATGFGISYPPEKGGIAFTFIHDKYKHFYKDILEKQYKLDIPRKLDFGIGSCVSYIDDKQNSYILNIELIIKSIDIIMSNLDKGGNMIINMSLKNIYICYNLINILHKYFTNIKTWKSSTVWGMKNSFYIFCYDFNLSYNNDITKYMDDIKNKYSKFNTSIICSQEAFNKITQLLNPIYIIRINCWLNKLV